MRRGSQRTPGGWRSGLCKKLAHEGDCFFSRIMTARSPLAYRIDVLRFGGARGNAAYPRRHSLRT